MTKTSVDPFKTYSEAIHNYMNKIRHEILTDLLAEQAKDNLVDNSSWSTGGTINSATRSRSSLR